MKSAKTAAKLEKTTQRYAAIAAATVMETIAMLPTTKDGIAATTSTAGDGMTVGAAATVGAGITVEINV